MDDAEEADAVLRHVARQLKSKRQRAIDVFRKIDESGDGSVSAEEFLTGLRDMQMDMNEHDFTLLMTKLDRDGSGDVTLREFARALKAAEKTGSNDHSSSFLPALTPRSKRAIRGNSYRDAKRELAEPQKEELDVADEFLIKTVAQLNERKTRMIDLFRRIDLSGDGAMSVREFRAGLLGMGFMPSKEEFRALVEKLDKDRSGDVSIAEFDNALRRAVRLAKREGRGAELTTWHGEVKELYEPTNWTVRSVSGIASECFASTFSAFNNSTSQFASGGCPQSSGGPMALASSNLVGRGSAVDGSVGRVRLFDRGPAGAGPRRALTLKERADSRARGFAHAAARGRFTMEPPNLLPLSLTRGAKTQYCATAKREYGTWEMIGGVQKFVNSPMTQSCIDSVVFGHDMDFSGETQFDEDFTMMYEGAAGMPSWHWGQ